MPSKIRLTPRNLSELFWNAICAADDERSAARDRLVDRLVGLDSLRSGADYNTGSIGVSAAWCLYSLTRHVQPSRILEVGTFIGRSTVAMAQALDDADAPGEIATCDLSNDIKIPWTGRTRITQFPGVAGGEMMSRLEGTYDLVFLDGRLQPSDLAALDQRITGDTVFALDDFEGAEKGVSNLMILSRLEKLKGHLLIYPPPQTWSSARGFSTSSLIAAYVPYSMFEFARQG